MKGWRTIRHEAPEALEGITVMQQPAAFLDGVIHLWSLEDLAARYGRSVWQRDALATHSTAEAEAAMQAGWQIQALIQGGMTPVLQITDTDLARLLKVYAVEAKEEIRADLHSKAKLLGHRTDFELGTYECIKVVCEALKKLKATVADTDLVLAAAVRNGLLAYRPNLLTGKMERSDEGGWSGGGGATSHLFDPTWVGALQSYLYLI